MINQVVVGNKKINFITKNFQVLFAQKYITCVRFIKFSLRTLNSIVLIYTCA